MNWKKVQLIIKREYLTRVRTRAFILTTLLAPVGLLLIIGIPIAIQFMDTDSVSTIAVVGGSEEVNRQLKSTESITFVPLDDADPDTLRNDVAQGQLTGYILLLQGVVDGNTEAQFYYNTGGIDLPNEVRRAVRNAIEDVRLAQNVPDPKIQALIKKTVGFNAIKLSKTGEEEGNPIFFYAVGYVMGFFIYMAIFIYGAIVLRGVIEEKSNRIIEVIVSSVKPFELLMGKVLGVGAVGLTQFIIWALLTQGILIGAAPIMAIFTPAPIEVPEGAEVVAVASQPNILANLPEVSIWVWLAFVVYFLFGYLIYSAMFAAVGSAVDNEQDAQQLQLPVTLPVIIPILLIGKIITDPESSISVISSMIPLFSPILMMVRIVISDVPFWQWGGSIVLMALTFLGLVWVSARIYRVGILMYGKKPSFAELYKWIRYAE